MSPRKKSKKIEVERVEETEDREALAEEDSEGTLSPSPELEEALREAAAAVDEVETRQEAERVEEAEAAPEEAEAGAAEGEAASEEDLALELEQAQERLLRLQADFENFRRRALKERTEAHQYGHQNLVKDLLLTVDNLDRAIDHAQKSEDGDLDGLLQGVDLVRRDLLAALARNGVASIEAVGKAFDPAHHEAVAQAPDASVAPNTVTEELQKGYLLRDRLLRPSRVIVSREPDEEGNDTEKTQEGEVTD
ncbi:MAG: nucleotide exchange factor GrpE [Deltaproteobacteria bacterium]|nr:nucleotide exchange factor GrpE [Deltaproteobacteria bacterium]